MTLTQVVTELQKASLLNDLTYPQARDAVKWATEMLLDLKDLKLAAELVMEKPHDELRRQLLSECLERLEARAAA